VVFDSAVPYCAGSDNLGPPRCEWDRVTKPLPDETPLGSKDDQRRRLRSVPKDHVIKPNRAVDPLDPRP